MLTDDEEALIEEKLKKYAALEDEDDLTAFLLEEEIAEGDVEFRAFPLPEKGSSERIRITATVAEKASWFERLSSYSPGYLQNGGPMYQALSDELTKVVDSALGEEPTLRAEKGSLHYTTEIKV